MGVLAVNEIITVRENKSNGIRCNRNNKIPQCKSRICRYQSGRSGFWVFLCEENPGDHHGAINANADHFPLEFFGNASHAVRQQNGTDANMTAIKAYNAIEFMVAKEVEPHDVVVFNAGEIKGGTANNIISDYCVMNCTLRTWNDKTEQKLLDGIKNITELTAKMSGATAKYTQLNRYPALYNDDIIVERVKNAAAKVIGTDNVLPQDERSLGAEDFAYFANEKPSALFWLGVANNEREFSGTHTSGFDIDENALDVGVKIFKQFVFDNMDNT